MCIIELGGTIGDIEGMPFVEAFRQFQFRVGRENFCSIHVSLVPQPKATGEHKTKPTQVRICVRLYFLFILNQIFLHLLFRPPFVSSAALASPPT